MASFTSTSWNLPVATLLKSELDIVRTFSIHDFYPTLKSSNAIEGFTKFVRIIIRSTGSTQIGRSKAGQKQSQEKIEHLKIPKKNQLRTYLLDKTRLILVQQILYFTKLRLYREIKSPRSSLNIPIVDEFTSHLFSPFLMSSPLSIFIVIFSMISSYHWLCIFNSLARDVGVSGWFLLGGHASLSNIAFSGPNLAQIHRNGIFDICVNRLRLFIEHIWKIQILQHV